MAQPDLEPRLTPMPEPTRRSGLIVLPDAPISFPNNRPLEPIQETAPNPPPPEPAPWTASAKEWDIWIAKRDSYENFSDAQKRARTFAQENDLRGVPFS
jgi:hypothetical protein